MSTLRRVVLCALAALGLFALAGSWLHGDGPFEGRLAAEPLAVGS